MRKPTKGDAGTAARNLAHFPLAARRPSRGGSTIRGLVIEPYGPRYAQGERKRDRVSKFQYLARGLIQKQLSRRFPDHPESRQDRTARAAASDVPTHATEKGVGVRLMPSTTKDERLGFCRSAGSRTCSRWGARNR